MKVLCDVMEVSRAGYYKWLNRKPTERDVRREEAAGLVTKVHESHRTHGYRWTAAYIRLNCGVRISDNFVYKIYRIYGLRAETKHRSKYRPRKIRDKYPNLIFTAWDSVDRPRQVIVSDMTAFWAGCRYWELTVYFDVFTKQILSWSLTCKRGDRRTYINGLKDLLELLEGIPSEDNITVIHTDQGSVYSSLAYNNLIKDPNIYRSMSRDGKPTDNPVNESLNGWIK